MNTRSRFGLISLALSVVLLISSFVATRQVQANTRVNVGISIFHDALAPYGNWVNHRTYGQVWYPRGVAYNWRPYTDGYWTHTYEYGWLWVSYQPWGWAPFHYGRWAWDNWYGWIWVPGRIWAPAWVFWRSGGGYAAWAPMPPNVIWRPGVGLNISYFNYGRDLSWDSWVAVREYDLPHRHISRHIFAPQMNPRIINVTNNINNVTIINNTIVNQGVPVKQIEALTGKPVESVVPKVLNQLDVNTAQHTEGQPNIIRLPIAAPTAEEIHHNEELARKLDGKNPDGTRTEIPSIVNPERSNNHKPRVPGRLVGVSAHVQSPYAKPEQQNPLTTEPIGQTLPLPGIPETPLLGFGLDSDSNHKETKAGRKQKEQVSAQPKADAAPVPPMQTEIRQDEQNGQQMDTQRQQTEITREELRQMRQQEEARQQELLNQQQMEEQQQQVERSRKEERQMRQQEEARQQELLNQQQMEEQQQQVERLRKEERQMRQQEEARQQELLNQQQMEEQQQQVERSRKEERQMRQQEEARQQELLNQQQMEEQQQQVERSRKEERQMRQQEEARQQELLNQQQMEMQQQEAARQQEIQNRRQLEMQQQEAARQQEIQNRQQLEMQQQEAARQQEIQNRRQLEMQQQEAVRQQEIQNRQQLEMQQQEAARQQEIQNRQQLEMQQREAGSQDNRAARRAHRRGME